MTKKLSRRALLRGVGVGAGVAIALPALEAMNDGSAEAAESPKRLVIYHFGDGAPMIDWTPTGTSELGWTASPILEALSFEEGGQTIDMIDHVNVLTGLSNHDVTAPFSDNLHDLTVPCMLTGVAPARSGGAIIGAAGASVDQVAGEHIGAATPLSSLTLAALTKTELTGYMSYTAATSPVAPITDPVQLFSMIFSGFSDDPAEAALILARRQSVLDYVSESIGALEQRVGQADRVRLEEHLDAIRELEKTLSGLGAGCTKPSEPVGPFGDGVDKYDTSLLPARADALVELAAMALRCDLTRVLFFSITPTGGGQYDFLGLSQGDHGISHWSPDDAFQRQEYVTMTKWKLSYFAKLIHRLQSLDEGDGSLLDHSAAVCLSEFSDGTMHSDFLMPVLVAGGIGGMATGRHLIYPCEALKGTALKRFVDMPYCTQGASEVPLCNLWLTMLHAVGATAVGSFGQNGDAVIDGLWV